MTYLSTPTIREKTANKINTQCAMRPVFNGCFAFMFSSIAFTVIYFLVYLLK